MVISLATNYDVVLVAFDLPPERRLCRGILGQAAEVRKLSFAANFRERGTIALGNCNELSALWTRPAPAAGTLADNAAEVKVTFEVIEIDLLNL
jgi:hypothetical protein